MPQLGGKSFTDRSTSGTPILQRSDTGTVNWTTGWVNTDGTTTVADGAKLTFNHNLGTTNITVDVYVCDNASGTGEVNKLEEVFFQNQAGAFVSHGCQVQDITNEQLTVSLSYYGYAHWSDGGTAGSVDASTTRGFGASNGPDNKQKYIKVVATAGSGSGGGGNGEVLLDNVEFGTRIDSNRGRFFTHSSTNPEIFDASGLSVNQPVRIDIDVKLNGLDYYSNTVTERDVHIYWVQMKSPTSTSDTYKQGSQYRACWQQHVVIQPAGNAGVGYETPYRLHTQPGLGSVGFLGSSNYWHVMFGEEKYMYQDQATNLVYRVGSDGKFYVFIVAANDGYLATFGNGTSASGKIYYTVSARLTYL